MKYWQIRAIHLEDGHETTVGLKRRFIRRPKALLRAYYLNNTNRGTGSAPTVLYIADLRYMEARMVLLEMWRDRFAPDRRPVHQLRLLRRSIMAARSSYPVKRPNTLAFSERKRNDGI